MEIKFNNFLVTGGTGFIGAHLVQALLTQKKFIVTTFRTYNPDLYFFRKKLNQQVVLCHCDIHDYDRILEIISTYKIECIIHLAAQSLVEIAYYQPKLSLSTNILGTINILEAARQLSNIKGVIIASSDKAYGKSEQSYIETDPLRGDHPYEVSKSAEDLIAQAYYKTYQIPIVITRFGNVYGEGDLHFSRIIPETIKAIIQNQVLEVRSNGLFQRDYIYIKDVISGYLSILKKFHQIKGETFNFGSNDNLSVIDLINKIQSILKLKIKYSIRNQQINEIPYQSLNWQKAKKLLNWYPRVKFNQGIKKTFNWYKQNYFKNK